MSAEDQAGDSNAKHKGPEALPLRAKTPRASLRLRKPPLYLVITLLCALIGLAIIHAFSPQEFVSKISNDSKRPAFLSDAVRNLPNDYSGIKKTPPKLGPPLKGELGPTELAYNRSQEKQLSPEEKYLLEQKLARLKQQSAAHAADVTFSGIQLTRTSISELGGNQSEEMSAILSRFSELNPRDEDNRQDEKREFLDSFREDSPYARSLIYSPLSPYQLMAGTVISGVLLTGINSDLPGQILGQTSQNVFDTAAGKYLLLPQGTKVIGEYDSRIAYGQERVLVVWTRLIFPNGKSISLESMPGVDLSGYAGLHERVNNHYFRLLSGVVFGSLLGASAQIAHGSNRTVDPTFGQLAFEGTAQNINQAGQQITRKNLNIQPTLEISPGQ
ncbi:MAG: hypothetical protein DCC75_12900, partial [Proteobacteria bacterium]